MTKVIPISAGIGNCFLVIENTSIFLVDTGSKGFEYKIAKAITSRGYNLSDLKFIFLTHTHYDHAGSAAKIKELTSAPIIVHESEVDYLVAGFHPMPKGTSLFYKIIIALGKFGNKTKNKVDAVTPDITFSDYYDLNKFGFDANIIHTPGHTKGSSCLIINKNALVGDTLFNVFGSNYPPFANDTKLLKYSWEVLLDENDVLFYYPAHGKRIKRDEFKMQGFKKINSLYHHLFPGKLSTNFIFKSGNDSTT